MKIKNIKAKNVKDGDILYISYDYMLLHNPHLLGKDYELTGADMIIIVDDIGGDKEWMINGGHMFNFNSYKDIFEKIGHYSELLFSNN